MLPFFVGIVEDRTSDPFKMGRCKVRVLGVHTDDKVVLPTKDLPWAMPASPITSASMNGIGDSPVGPVEGSYVIVIFLDGDDKQKPLMLGTVPGYPIAESKGKAFEDPKKTYPKKDKINEPDANRLARNQKIDQTIVKKKEDTQLTNVPFAISDPGSWKQPTIPYNARYPFNHVFESESGIITEIDDTPKAERFHQYHKSGTFTEIDVNGNQVNRIVGNGYEIIDKDGYVYVKGTCVINVMGDANVKVGRDLFVETSGKANVVAHDNINMSSGKSITLQAVEDIQLFSSNLIIQGKSINANVSEGVDILAGKNVDMQAPKVYTQSQTATPKKGNFSTWSRFKPESLHPVIEPPSREMDTMLAVEGYSADDLKAVGLDPNDPKFRAPTDPKTGKPVEPTSITKFTAEGGKEEKVTPITQTDCDNIPDSTYVTAYHTLSDVFFPESGGSIKAQHDLTPCEIVTNMKKVGANVINRVIEKYGEDNVRLTSYFRKEGNKYSKEGVISRHELGLATDMQFTDISTYKQYVERAKDMATYIYAEKILVETNDKGSLWIHVQLPE